jgi:hypothetical protein
MAWPKVKIWPGVGEAKEMVGGWLIAVTLIITIAEVVLEPRLSVATAFKACEPTDTPLQDICHGACIAVPIRVALKPPRIPDPLRSRG